MSEDIVIKSDVFNTPDDLGGMCSTVINIIPWKVTAFVFIAFIILNTSTFIDSVLSAWPGAVDGRYPSERGLLIQASLLTFGVIVVSICSEGNLI